MIRGLAKREMLRTAFGKYVTPEIRDEILGGRIPLDGELKDVTVIVRGPSTGSSWDCATY
jgi:adenylate cyclase